jgi:hypothetical protein
VKGLNLLQVINDDYELCIHNPEEYHIRLKIFGGDGYDACGMQHCRVISLSSDDYIYQPNLTELAQVSQYLSMIVAPSILKYAICVAILPQFTQNFSLVGSFVKGSIYRRVFNS